MCRSIIDEVGVVTGPRVYTFDRARGVRVFSCLAVLTLCGASLARELTRIAGQLLFPVSVLDEEAGAGDQALARSLVGRVGPGSTL